MPMNARLLRPLASGFNPRQIAGLAAWWDSTDNTKITTDTGVSAWVDKVNGYTLAQSTGANQPTISSINGKQAFDYNGSSQFMTSTAAGLIALATGSSVRPTTIFNVIQPDVANQSTFPFVYGSTADLNPVYGSIHPQTGSVWRTFYRDNSFAGVFVSSAATYAADAAYITATSTDSDIVGRVNGGEVINTANTRAAFAITLELASVGALTRSSTSLFFDGKIGDVLIYNRVLSASEIAKVEGYLAWKWGLQSQLPSNHPYAYSFPGLGSQPRPSNADALDWESAVYANSGSVSVGTLAAVNTFANAIDAAGIRDRFYRLNLFCGNSDASLIAPRVPLYRGPSRTGTQYGNTIDTNNNFVAGDYAETGASSGLKANGTNKYLDTGVMANEFTASDSHLGIGLRATETRSAAFRSGIAAYNGAANSFEVHLHATTARTGSAFFTRFGTATDCAGDNIGGATGALAVGDILAAYPAMYRNGAATGATATTSQDYPSAHKLYVFAANNQNTSVINYTDARINWYSIGLTMTSAQALSYYNAVAAFNTALSRT